MTKFLKIAYNSQFKDGTSYIKTHFLYIVTKIQIKIIYQILYIATIH